MNKLNKLSIAFFVCFMALSLFILTDIFVNYPILDDFGAIVNFIVDYLKTTGFRETIKLLFSQNNDFRLVVLKLITLFDYYIFGQVNFEHLRIIGFSFFLSTLFFFFRLGRFQTSKFFYFLPVPLLLISFAYAEINSLAMESLSHFVVIFFVVSCLYYLFETKKIVLPILLLILGIYSNGNGLLLVPIGILGLLITKDYKRLGIWSLFSALAIFVFFLDYEKGNTPLDASVFKRIAYVFPIYLGGIGGMESIKINMIFGILGIILAIYFLIIKKSYQNNTALSALMLFFLGTYLLISSKRQYTDSTALLRGAYLINSLCIFVTFYILFYKINLSKWIESKNTKLANWSFIAIFIICLVYQARNYTKWIQVFGYQKRAIQSVLVMISGNTKQLYTDEGTIHNIPLNMRPGLDTLIKRGVFDNSDALESLIVKPLSLNSSEISGELKNKIDILSIDGTQIVENPYITVSAKIKDYLKNPLNSLGIVCNQNGVKNYYEIPLKNDKLFLLKPVKGRDFYFEFMIPKKILKSGSFELTFLKFENKRIFQSRETLKINWNGQTNSNLALSKFINLDIKNSSTDSLSKPEFYEAYYNGQKHEIFVELDATQKENTNYLQFTDTESIRNFQIELTANKDLSEKNPANVIFSQSEAKSFLKNRSGLFKLSLISKKGEENYKTYPLKSLYYFRFY
ncbi:hypothetical protein EGI26_10905 [Lacihabitans sp. CCS-44]|uniref:hypothetical protein n=1 Tax=Lacihabitans sp. CCS-44 TaxID=2487331 RepID=UPI0020CD42E8|nr:hypothetical protein [Lacihabitans sp. CCS-44]MCP9755664.1 hypothetical protein [Lacihabitans sp. CCS-44]